MTRHRSPAPRRLLALAALLLALLPSLAAPALAQPGDARRFALVSASRDGGAAELTLRLLDEDVYDVVLSLADAQGRVLGAEASRFAWREGAAHSFRFEIGDASALALSLHYRLPDGTRAREEVPLALAAQRARVDIVDVARAGEILSFTLRNLGDAASAPATLHLEDATGERLGSPLSRDLPPLDPGNATQLAFEVTRMPASLCAVLSDANGTRRIELRVPEAPEPRLELVQAHVDGSGRAAFTLAHVAGPALVDALARLETMDGQRVGSPSALVLGKVEPGAMAELAYQISDDLSNVTLVVEYLGGKTSFPVILDEAADGTGRRSGIKLATDLPSREEKPGAAAAFALRIENEDDDDALVSLRAEGLPPGYEVSFAVDGSAVRTMVVPERATRQLVASVKIPDGASRDAGKTLPFQVLVDKEGDLVATLDLSLTVRGAGRLELQGQNWFTSLTPGASSTLTILVRNTGSAPVHDVELRAPPPGGWESTFDPPVIAKLDPGQAQEVQVSIRAADDAGGGRYLLDVSAANADISARTRSLSVEVAQEERSSLRWILGAAGAGLVATTLIVKLRRR